MLNNVYFKFFSINIFHKHVLEGGTFPKRQFPIPYGYHNYNGLRHMKLMVQEISDFVKKEGGIRN